MEELAAFKKLGLSENCLQALVKKGFEEPTLIQDKIIPLFLGKDIDIIGQAQTGTGKTAAFGLPLIEKLKVGSRYPQALILAPTRELALQVAQEINSLKGNKNLQIAAVYGGQSIEEQLRRLHKGVDIVVGTPGRILDHLRRKSLNLATIDYLILDEADEMLNMGFIEDVEEILKHTNKNKRILLFSATMPERIVSLAKRYMKEYEIIRIKAEQPTVALTDQIYFEVQYADKLEALCRIVDVEHEFYGLVFCRTKIDVDELARKLIDRGYDAEALHGDISQFQRERILDKFKKKRINILVATDVAARGIDIMNLTHVINYSLPQDPESYVHRIGRTGRAGKEGTAITFVTPDETRKLIFIKRIAKTNIRKERLPQISEIIRTKKEKIKERLEAILGSESYMDYLSLAEDMLKEQDAKNVLASLLKHTFGDKLDEKSYNEIRDVSIDTKGKARLFVALGSIDRINAQKLVDFIREKTRVDSRKIQDVRIFEKFSFVTVPFEDAEIIVQTFKKLGTGKRPIIEIAKERKGPREGHRGSHRNFRR
ncbi:MAG: DEAD/DEAH box helicase [Candidatus Omnitrophica bacterium]|jgi:ATP-dependent RNA helicase DeaD|nr:DEAD/DEAH box helicase [Candidatus Omnitrophota bacterium]